MTCPQCGIKMRVRRTFPLDWNLERRRLYCPKCKARGTSEEEMQIWGVVVPRKKVVPVPLSALRK